MKVLVFCWRGWSTWSSGMQATPATTSFTNQPRNSNTRTSSRSSSVAVAVDLKSIKTLRPTHWWVGGTSTPINNNNSPYKILGQAILQSILSYRSQDSAPPELEKTISQSFYRPKFKKLKTIKRNNTQILTPELAVNTGKKGKETSWQPKRLYSKVISWSHLPNSHLWSTHEVAVLKAEEVLQVRAAFLASSRGLSSMWCTTWSPT